MSNRQALQLLFPPSGFKRIYDDDLLFARSVLAGSERTFHRPLKKELDQTQAISVRFHKRNIFSLDVTVSAHDSYQFATDIKRNCEERPDGTWRIFVDFPLPFELGVDASQLLIVVRIPYQENVAFGRRKA